MKRPWGEYKVLGENPVCVKIITVKANSRLSLQTHKLRDEVWLALQPGLYAHIGDDVKDMKVLQRLLVERGVKHRIENPTNKPLQLIELMYGEYDEDDICRLEDDYGRN
jgi:mannose-1-phosphate guanylyltransferase/mannose-6-phosphate isomerase